MTDGGTEQRPRFSIIAACYNVERFLAEFFRSLEAQTVEDEAIEVIAVDDGSTDHTRSTLERLGAQSRFRVRVVGKENGGQASARNVGIEEATGQWLTFIDPDDWVDEQYFDTVQRFIDEHSDVELIGTCRVLMLEDDDGVFDRKNHPLDAMFQGDRLIDLRYQTEFFHGSAPSAFVRASRIAEFDLRFDESIRPNFEDGHFCATYLLNCPAPKLGLLRSATYFYRKRSDQSSTLQNSVAQPTRYTVVPKRGFIDVLERGAALDDGVAPEWLQNMILYELSWYFSADRVAKTNGNAAVGEVAAEFIGHLRRIRELLSDDVIRSFAIRKFDPEWRQIMLHAFDPAPWFSSYVVMQAYDGGRNEVKVAFRFCGEIPKIEITLGDRVIDVAEGKVRTHVYFSTPLLREWSSWLHVDGDLSVRLDGQLVQIRTAWKGVERTRISAQQVRSRFGASPVGLGNPAIVEPPPPLTAQQRVLGLGKRGAEAAARVPFRARRKFRHLLPKVSRPLYGRLGRYGGYDTRFAGAWVMVDRLHNANDSAEVLFRYLRDNRPDINAWFVIEHGSADYERLVADGYGDRLASYGTLTWKMLMKNAVVVASSHADKPIHEPPALARVAPPKWRRVFLQHGVIKDDLSDWLNPKKLDIFVVSTEDELESIVGADTGYVYSGRETKLTGLPRFDQLERARESLEAAGGQKSLVVVAPTWRQWLFAGLAPGTQRRELVPDFEQTDLVVQWSALLADRRVAAACEQYGYELVMLPHPNLENALGVFEGLSGVPTLSYDQADLHTVFARTALLLTDYSSVAFNIAYLESPTVYFQFDADRMFSGEHVGRKGYFDYETMGFGPVTFDLEHAVNATIGMLADLAATGHPPEPWRSRIRDTFPHRDGRASERVTGEIEQLLAAANLVTDGS